MCSVFYGIPYVSSRTYYRITCMFCCRALFFVYMLTLLTKCRHTNIEQWQIEMRDCQEVLFVILFVFVMLNTFGLAELCARDKFSFALTIAPIVQQMNRKITQWLMLSLFISIAFSIHLIRIWPSATWILCPNKYIAKHTTNALAMIWDFILAILRLINRLYYETPSISIQTHALLLL